MLSQINQIQPIEPQKLNQLTAAIAALNNEQKLWLSGYLAGQATVTTLNTAAESQVQHATESKLTVLYGSQTGNAKQLAENYCQAANDKGIQAQLVSLADYKSRQITKERNIVLIVSTHGEGDAPDDAEIFYEYLLADTAPELKQLNFSVLALGDSSYEQFCQTGIDFDLQFEKLGGKRIYPRVDCDLDFDDDAHSWQYETLTFYTEHLNQAEAASNVVPINTMTTSQTYNRNNPFQAEILTIQPLTTDESVKSIYHVELSLEDSGITYEPGDSLGVFAHNPDSDVAELLEILKINPDESVVFQTEKHRITDLLTHTLEISLLNKKFLQYYAEQFTLNDLTNHISTHEKFTSFIKDKQLIDVIQEYPSQISAQQLVDNLPKITPRMYSIASSQVANVDEVHLTIALVQASKDRTGLVSGCLYRHAKVGDTMDVFVETNRHFKLPQEPTTPVIMIGPGTGIAPFRSFLQHRKANEHTGENWLFFGNPNFNHDFLYQLEWQKHIESGLLNQLDLAFSRDQAEKIYVQHRLKEQAQKIWQWLESGAHLYVCGDKDHMAKDVEATLIEIITTHGELDNDAAIDYLKTLKRNARYQKDVY